MTLRDRSKLVVYGAIFALAMWLSIFVIALVVG